MDVMQNTYLKAYQKLGQFSAKAKFSTWLIRIGINEALQWKRKTNKLSIMDSDDTDMSTDIYLPKDNNTPESHLIYKDYQSVLEKIIDELPTKYKSVFILSQIEQMSHSEISECLEISETNTKVRIHRAKKHICDRMGTIINEGALFEFGNSKCDRIVKYVMNTIMEDS